MIRIWEVLMRLKLVFIPIIIISNVHKLYRTDFLLKTFLYILILSNRNVVVD
jgi:hypothetical protein